MNRKERRAARKQGKGGNPFAPAQGLSPAAVSANLLAAAVQHYRAGRLDDAERVCRDVLMFDRGHFEALHLLGVIAAHAGNFESAAEILGQALTVNDGIAECHFHRADVLRTLGRNHDAMIHLAQAAALKPDYAAAHVSLGDLLVTQNDLGGAWSHYEHALTADPGLVQARYGLGNVALLQGRLDEAAALYRSVVASTPFAEAFSNLGIVLAAQSKWDEAIQQYRQALALNPDLVDVYRNLARALLMQGEPAQALEVVRRGLAIAENEEIKALFAQCVVNQPGIAPDQDLCTLVARALSEGWSRATELSGFAADLFKRSDNGRAFIAQARALALPHSATGTSHPVEAIAAGLHDPLLLALLESAPVPDIELERIIGTLRSAMLERAMQMQAETAIDEADLRFCCMLAQQCFINEYVCAESEADVTTAAQLQERLDAALAAGAPLCPLWPAALGCYIPLHRLAHAQALLGRQWPDALNRLLDRQIREPQIELELRATVAALTPIEDEVSQQVRRQYEEMPYPRWITTARPGNPIGLDWYLRSQFPAAPIQPFQPGDALDILVAGCGTGQHAIETAQRFAGARVLAIDLSLASLSYAKRKAQERRLRNVEYRQADILKLGRLGMRFDLIEASGVLHHLGDPLQGWRILVSLLRPNGFMHIGLYSARARANVRAARAFIAEHGFGNTAAEIRRCRQALLALDEEMPARSVSRYLDFFSTSECRDLLFHVQEHEFSIPEIKAFLAENNLWFLGFSGPPLAAYRARFPDDPAMLDLDRWHRLEADEPLAFVNMYQLWVQKIAG